MAREGSEVQVVSVESVDHADGTLSVVVTYGGKDAVAFAPPDGRQRFDCVDAAERDAMLADFQGKIVEEKPRGRRGGGDE
jgi:hypothetical protein